MRQQIRSFAIRLVILIAILLTLGRLPEHDHRHPDVTGADLGHRGGR